MNGQLVLIGIKLVLEKAKGCEAALSTSEYGQRAGNGRTGEQLLACLQQPFPVANKPDAHLFELVISQRADLWDSGNVRGGKILVVLAHVDHLQPLGDGVRRGGEAGLHAGANCCREV
eukprot:6174955-Pleurochrysis_carterae.AAC.1